MAALGLRKLPGFGGALRLLAALALLPVVAAAAETDDELAAKATDPTASLMSFQLNDWYTANYHGQEGSSNSAVFRAAIPFELAGTNQIFRVTQPYVTSSSRGPTGFTDTTIFDLVVFNQPWGRWGVGISGTLPTGRDGLSTDKWTAGPAVGFVNSATKGTNWGLFVQSFFSFAGKDEAPSIGFLNFQPILSHQLGEGRSLSMGNSALVYDTEKSRWSSLLVSVNYGQVTTLWGHKWRPNIEAGYDFRDAIGNPKWVIRAGIALLLPTH